MFEGSAWPLFGVVQEVIEKRMWMGTIIVEIPGPCNRSLQSTITVVVDGVIT